MDVLVVDDEPLARQRLVRMLAELPDYSCVAEAGNAAEALAQVQALDPDIVLLDIAMPGEDGLAAARRLAALDDPPAIIFCTAYDQYALDAFETEAVGYLMKPVNRAQLQQALAKAHRLNKVQLASLESRQSEQVGNQRQHLAANTRRGVELVPLANVRCFIADHKYVTVCHTGGEILIDDSLKDLAEEFGDRLVRVHRNALVVLEHIEAMERNGQGQFQLRMAGVELQPLVSRRHVSGVRELLSQL